MSHKFRAARALDIVRCTKRVAGFVTFVVVGVLGGLAVSEVVAQETDVPPVSEVSMFSAPASGDTYQFGDPIEVRVDFDRVVTVTGTPQINLTAGDNTRAVGLRGLPSTFGHAPVRCSSGTRWWRRTATRTASVSRPMRSA